MNVNLVKSNDIEQIMVNKNYLSAHNLTKKIEKTTLD